MHRPAVRAQRSRARRRGDRRTGAEPLTHLLSARPHLLVAGISVRAAAASAARAGFAVTAIDAFADLDQHPAVAARAVAHDARRPFTADALADAACRAAGDAVVYLSPLDNHPPAVERIARGRQLWGNPPAVLRRVRDPYRLEAALREAGLPAARLADGRSAARVELGWLQKRRASGGGRGVRPWIPGTPLEPGCYLQERIPGPACSVVFVAAARRAVPIGLSYQLVGDARFGAAGFQYCGSIIPADDDAVLGRAGEAARRAVQLADVVTSAFGLVGLNGIDFIAGPDGPVAIEVNPRWCGSMELIDRGSGTPILELHAAACTAGVSLAERRPESRARGKAIVFARDSVTVGDTDAWLGDDTVADIPRAGTEIQAGSPICTVFASGADVMQCRSALAVRAKEIYAALDGWRGSSRS